MREAGTRGSSRKEEEEEEEGREREKERGVENIQPNTSEPGHHPWDGKSVNGPFGYSKQILPC